MNSRNMGSLVHESNNLSSSLLDRDIHYVGQDFSLLDLISKPESFFRDKIFEIIVDSFDKKIKIERTENKL